MKFPKGPEIKLGRSGKKAGGDSANSDSKAPPMPEFVNDVYRDMRDRRLLLPALALLIAIIAVPAMLSADPEPPAPAPPLTLDAGVLALDPAVSPEQLVGVRDYDKRLAALKQSNPFDSSIRRETKDGGGVASGAPTDAPAGSGTGLPTEPPASDAPTAPTGSTSPTTPSAPAEDPYLVASQIDIHMGPVGERKDIDEVDPGDLVPSKRAPVAMFLGAPTDLSTAEFLISRDVTQVKGADCKPKPENCQFLSLETGQPVYFKYGPQGKRFALVVNHIRRVRVDGEPGTTG